MNTFLDSNHFKTIIYTKYCCALSFVPHKGGLNHFMREIAKNAYKITKRNLARNFKHMTIVFDSNDFKTIIYTKWCCVLCFAANKPSLNHLWRESAKNA